jgi:hypothetical protein
MSCIPIMPDIEQASENLKSAPHESGVLVTQPYTDEFSVRLGDGTAAVAVSHTLQEILSEHLTGCGRVELHSMTLKYKFSDDDQFFKIAMNAATSALSLDSLLGFEGAEFVSANPLSKGKWESLLLTPYGNVSRQIQPVSSQLPSLKVMVAAPKGMVLYLNIKVAVLGPRRKALTLK